MADLSPYFSDRMYYDETVYPQEVRLGEDGFYRWRCTLDKFHDRQMYCLLLKIIAVLSIGGLVLGFLLARVPLNVLREDPSRYQTLLWQRRLLYAALGYAGFFAGGLLMIGLVRLIEGGPSRYWYRMNDEFVQIKPSGKESGINAFDNVKRAELFPEHNEIRLISRWGKCPLLMRTEDFDLIKTHILAHIPEKAEIIEQQSAGNRPPASIH